MSSQTIDYSILDSDRRSPTHTCHFSASSEEWTKKILTLYLLVGYWCHIRARHIPLPNSLGHVKLPVGQVNLSKVSFYMLYKQIEKNAQLQKSGKWKFVDMCQALTSSPLYGNRDVGQQWAGFILCMRPANERRRYIVTSSLIGWAHTQNDPWVD